ncbi:uncharacterized protein LOC130745606 isoform X3 [Lotus japonicus]|uniref:uncharacterized protein LOC130745606 isoform X3 n=1 Tax=Lotus japonicus TaxID=34305 RepID=UPI002589AAAA|nr:uncharacterized protein LOC130745606 isoform X3 [Lotus japonicus]
MDAVVNAAVEEICAQVEEGLTVSALWTKLEASPSLPLSPFDLPLSPSVKRAIWTNLLRVPTLRFEPQPSSTELEEAENLNLTIFAAQTLVDSFVGLYGAQTLQQAQTRVLQLLAKARASGVTQSRLSKLLRIDGNSFHYVLRTLECQGLILKRTALEKKKPTSSFSGIATTNLVFLRRYAAKVTSHQRFELDHLEEEEEEEEEGSATPKDMLLKDYAPQMNAIREKLAIANGKVLLVSDIKKDLGYTGSAKRHKAWRQISHRLKVNGIVEQFDAKVNGKIEACLRLIDPITTGSGNDDKNSNSGKTCQVIGQFVELPVEHQIFDIIDAAGSDGITLKEICERLGIELKKSHLRLVNMCHRFGMKVQEEHCLKTKTIRVWTSKNFNPEPEVALIRKLDENKIIDQHVPESSLKLLSEFDASAFNGELVDLAKSKDIGTGAKPSCVSPKNSESNYVETPTELQELPLEHRGAVSNSKSVSLSTEAEVGTSGAFPSDVLKPFSTGSSQQCASLYFTLDNTRRANRILERLKDERFILRSEITRWLSSFEKSKTTKLDRKTIDRILAKLQEQGLCKCITVHSPVLTEYSRTKDSTVVVHPSVSLSPELFDDIQDKVRSFNNFIRSKSTSHQKNDELIPVMEGIQKSQSLLIPGQRAGKAESIFANGFILAKMIRAKLLHSFLWDYLHSSASHDDALSSKICVNQLTNNPHSSSKPFSLESAIKAIPVELFSQVVGCTNKYEEIVEKCKLGLRLSDLPLEEYKRLMDTCATGRLSLVIDILRRLKLIRMVTDLQSRDGVKSPDTFTHVMELRPYIEEPLSNAASSLNFMSLDLRPRIRHDFILSNRDAVKKYWQTLEYCYAAANKKSASYAFPGSVVPEVFRTRSWASTRLMTAEQRAELLKRLTKDDLGEKISYRDCEKIAKELNLTLEQVLSMYYSKRHHYPNQFNDEENENNSLEREGSSSRRRKEISTECRPTKYARIDAATDIVGMPMEEQYNLGIHSGKHATQRQEFEEDNNEVEGSQDCYPRISQCLLTKMKPTRQRRFVWSDDTDRQMVIQYVRHRAALGVKYHRIEWASLSDLPAPPRTCRRRMNLLNGNLRFRKAVNKLCNMLSERYAKQLEKSQNLSLNKDDCRQFVRPQSSKGVQNILSPAVEIQTTSLNGEAWDDFENKSIKTALDEIFRCKMMAKLEASSQKVQSQYEEWSDVNENDGYESQEKEITSAIPGEIAKSPHGKPHTISAQKSHRRRPDKKFTRSLNNKAIVFEKVYKSLAVSNAVELFKLVFLSTSTGPQAPNLLADILRHYSEHDLCAAFNYLREKKTMVEGNGSERFELSLQFLHSVSKSPFPLNTGKRAVKFSARLQERDKDLIEMGTNLAEDLQCGDIFHLFALVSLGELSISPCLPDNGVGEADDLRNAKRKVDANEPSFSDKAKKLKSLFGTEGEIISRREKGFPGIIISARRTAISRTDILDMFMDDDNNGQCFDANFQLNTGQSSNDSLPDHMPELFNSCNSVPVEENQVDSPWEAMAGYARRLMLGPSNQEVQTMCADVFRVVYAAIQKAGDQGLSIEEISQLIKGPGIEQG